MCENRLAGRPLRRTSRRTCKNDVWHVALLNRNEDGGGTVYKRNRYYDTKTGQFTQEDPIGVAGGLNLYGYADGDPVNLSDPYGLCPFCYPIVVGAGALGARLLASPTAQRLLGTPLERIQRQFGNILQELKKSNHFQAARLERRVPSGFNHAHELADFSRGLKNSIIELKQILSTPNLPGDIQSEALQLPGTLSRLRDQIQSTLR